MLYKKKCFTILMLFLIILLFCFEGTTIHAYNDYDPKIYSEVDINDNFDDESLIVILDSHISQKNTIPNKKFFRSNNIERIEDLTSFGYECDNKFEQILKLTISNKSKNNVYSLIKKLEKIPGIRYVGPNRIYKVQQNLNDTLYLDNELWSLDYVHALDAWDFSTGSSNIKVGVIDSGISDHPDLNDNVVEGYDFANNSTVVNDDSIGHGTHVSGIIGAKGNNGVGVSGINWNVNIVPLQVLDDDDTTNDSLCVSAINYATATYETEDPIRVLNFSISENKPSFALETAIRNYPGLFVCASGNNGYDIDTWYSYPAFYGSSRHSNPLTNMIVVGALAKPSDSLDYNVISDFSNYGSNTVDIYAPGTEIVSTFPTDLYDEVIFGVDHISEGYAKTEGTSQATPFVTGLAALLLSIDSDLTTLELKQCILSGADPLTVYVDDENTSEDEYDTTSHEVIKLNALNSVKLAMSEIVFQEKSLNDGTLVVEHEIDSSHDDYLERNLMFKLSITASGYYDMLITSDSSLKLIVFDHLYNIISPVNEYFDDSDNLSSSLLYLTVGTYYIKMHFIDTEHDGDLSLSVSSHEHIYSNWTYFDSFSHRGYCDCGQGEIVSKPHIISEDDIGKKYAVCLECGALLNMGVDIGGSLFPFSNVVKKSINGSYILYNGIIVLVDEDVVDYFHGKLIFYELREEDLEKFEVIK